MYYSRIADKMLNLKLRAFGATNIVGPKWCGKTEMALQTCQSKIMFQKDPNKEALIETAKITPSVLLEGAKPRLIDEWQDAPEMWDAVRAYCDEHHEKGQFILTGSTSKKVEAKHSGTGRISELRIYPMSLYESKESNGSVSLMDLFNGTDNLEKGCKTDLTYEDLIFAACRGGWPESVLMSDKEIQLEIMKDYFQQIYKKDMFQVDKVKRSSDTMRALLRSYARNISTLAKKTSLIADISSTRSISEATLDDYIDVLERLYIVEDLEGWCPSIRSKAAMRSGRKREFVDPSIAVAALGASPEFYSFDLRSFGFVFETLCIRDLRVYSSPHRGELSYYRDKYDLEVDCVLHLDDGRYALIEFNLGSQEGIEEGAAHLCEVESLIKKHNEKNEDSPMRLPSFKMIITGDQYGCKRPDGVYVVPIGCLKD